MSLPKELLAAWREVKASPRTKPERLVSFLVRMGGLQDPNGDVRFLIGGPRGRPGLLNKNGRTLDDALVLCQERGYISENVVPSISDLLELMDQDLVDIAVYSVFDQVQLRHAQEVDMLRTELAHVGALDAQSIPQLYSTWERSNGQEHAATGRWGTDPDRQDHGQELVDIEAGDIPF